MRLSIIANAKLVTISFFNMFKNLLAIDYLEDPFTTSRSTLLEVAHGGTMVVPSVAHTLHDSPMNRLVSSQLVVSSLSVV